MWDDIVSVILGILLCIAIGVVIRKPSNRTGLFALFVAGGGVNLFNGLKLCRDARKRNLGMSMMMLGALILIIGLYVLLFAERSVA